jgi:hypothetical protein
MGKEMLLIGGLCLFASVICLFMSKRMETKALGPLAELVRTGVGFTATSGEELKNRQAAVRCADCWLYVGLVLTIFGVILQTIGSTYP